MKAEQKQQARNLFLETGLTQAQVAALVGISEKTMSLWTNEGNWHQLRKLAKAMPMMVIDGMYQEIAAIGEAVLARGPGKQFATLEEAEIRRKTMASIRYVQEQQARSSHAEVMMNFLVFLRRHDKSILQRVTDIANEYILGEVKLGRDDLETYRLHELPPSLDEFTAALQSESPAGDDAASDQSLSAQAA